MNGELKITDILEGTGREARKGALVFVHYDGYLDDGSKFESSRDRNQMFSFVLGAGRVIKGWDQGLMGMKEGGKRKLYVPATLAYGERSTSTVPPNSNLSFEIEMFEVRPRE